MSTKEGRTNFFRILFWQTSVEARKGRKTGGENCLRDDSSP